jgi:two-component system, LytTR family, response regulator
MINALLIDDEPNCCEVLALLLEKHCPEVRVIGSCYSAEEALEALSRYKVELVFLDVIMPRTNGFQFLQQLNTVDFELIFTTSYDQYAVQAIRCSALDYLLKPVDREELKAAVGKAIRRRQAPVPQQLDLLVQKLTQPANNKSIALPTLEGLQLVPLDSIISCSSNSNYTILRLKQLPRLTISKTLKEVEGLLEEHQFLRVHHSHVVNLNEIRKYLRGEGGQLIMSDGSAVDVSRSKKEILLNKLQPSR